MALFNKYMVHKAKEGERWADLAYKYYGDSFKFAPIIMCNLDIPISPFLPVGADIIIPFSDTSKSNKVEDGLPIWKQ